MSIWLEVHQRFDPQRPPARPEWRVPRTYSPVTRIEQLLDFPVGTPRVLLTGTTGSGKSTELARVVEARAQSRREFVVLFDVEEHFERVVGDPPALLHRVQAWEILFLAAIKVIEEARERFGMAFDEQTMEDLTKAWRAAADAAGAEGDTQLNPVGLAKAASLLATAAAGATGGVSAAVAAAGDVLKWTIPLGRNKRQLPDSDEVLRGMLAIVNRILGEIQREHVRVLLVLDGLDKIQDIARARALFVESQLLGELECATIVCGPFALRHHPSLANVRHFKPVTLVNEPVFTPEAPGEYAKGVAVFEALFRARTRDLAADGVVSDAQLKRLAWSSGGRARDFVRLVRELAMQCFWAKVERAGEQEVDAAIDEARRLWESGLHKGHARVLAAVMSDPSKLPDDPLTWELLQLDRLLPYPNNSEWFYPHPLLTLNFLR